MSGFVARSLSTRSGVGAAPSPSTLKASTQMTLIAGTQTPITTAKAAAPSGPSSAAAAPIPMKV